MKKGGGVPPHSFVDSSTHSKAKFFSLLTQWRAGSQYRAVSQAPPAPPALQALPASMSPASRNHHPHHHREDHSKEEQVDQAPMSPLLVPSLKVAGRRRVAALKAEKE